MGCLAQQRQLTPPQYRLHDRGCCTPPMHRSEPDDHR